MRSAITLFSILMVLGTASAQVAGHGRGRCKRPSHSGMPVSSGASSVVPSTNASSTGLEESSVSAVVSSSSAYDSAATSASATITSAVASGSAKSSSVPSVEADSSISQTLPEPSVVSTSPSSTEIATSIASSTIGGELAVTSVPASASSASSASHSASAPVASVSTPVAAGDKEVGIAVNTVTGPLTSFTGSGSKLGWYYNWAIGANSDSAALEFVPMVWGESSVAGIKAESAKWKGVTHVLGFNEPDMGSNVGGSNIAASKAATLHQEWVTNLGGQYLIGSPAVARGSKKWMDDWLVACAGKCEYDFVPFHFYGTEVDQLIDYVQEFSAAYNKPLWLTEWACHDYNTGDICDQAKVEAFMKTAIGYFRESGLVERWAWFGAFPDMAGSGNANGLQNADGSVNEVGKVYLSL